MSKAFLSSLLFLTILNLQSQNIKDPGNSSEVTYTTTEINTMHLKLENFHAMKKILSMNNGTIILGTATWEVGSWRSGYFNTYVSDWYESDAITGYWSNHPLIRESARYSLGYVHGARNWSSTSIYETRALNGINYMNDRQRSDGSYIWWKLRPAKDTPNTDHSTTNNSYHFFTLGYALKALSEGHWFQECELNLDAGTTFDAITDAADFVSGKIEDELLDNNSNSNIKGLTAWGMASAYKATGNTQYKNDAISLVDTIVAHQDATTGMWFTGGLENTRSPNDPITDLENWIAGDFDGDGEDEVLQKFGETAIYYFDRTSAKRNLTLLGTNSKYTGNSTLEKWIVGNFDDDPEDEVLHKFQGNPKIYLWNHGETSFGSGAVYSGGSHIEEWLVGNFDSDDKDELLQKFVGSNTIYLWDGTHNFGTNSIYTGNSSIENWLAGDFDGDGNDEVLQKYAGNSNVYLWNHGSSFGANSIYSGSSIENWLAGDFDDDGTDEVLQKYTNSPTIYLWDGSFDFEENPVYSGNAHIAKWIAGDFDGDGKQEVLQKYSGAKIYLWNYGGNFNGSTPYTGSAHTTNWLVANTNDNTRDELFQVFSNSPAIYYWDDQQNCMGCYQVYNIANYQYYHDTRMQYHFFTLGAIIETYSIVSGTKKQDYAIAIKKAVNSVIDRLNPTDTDLMSNFYYDINNNLIPQFLREKESYNSREAIQQLPQLAYYAESDPTNFSATDIARIKNLANRMVHDDYPGYAYYKGYMNAINNNEYLDFYGGCSYNTFPSSSVQGSLSTAEDVPTKVAKTYPNPTESTIQIDLDAKTTGTYQLLMVDSKGNAVISQKVELKTGQNELALDLSNLKQGVYTLRVSGNQGILITQKIIKQ